VGICIDGRGDHLTVYKRKGGGLGQVFALSLDTKILVWHWFYFVNVK
jgi:hypothetical protein